MSDKDNGRPLGGLDVVRHLRVAPGPNKETPVIALTAACSQDDIAACMNAGMNAFVTKPVEGAELFAAIEQVLSADSLDDEIALSA